MFPTDIMKQQNWNMCNIFNTDVSTPCRNFEIPRKHNMYHAYIGDRKDAQVPTLYKIPKIYID